MTQKIFDEMKTAALSIWSEHTGHQKYIKQKITFINSIINSKDNGMTFYHMLDFENQKNMRKKVSTETVKYIKSKL